MRPRWGFAAWVATLAAPVASSAEPITASNWQRHPAIVEIRAIYRETSQAEAAGRLRKQHRSFEHCRSYEDTERTLYLDENGTIRSYHRGGGSEDSAAQWAYYYDRDGALRLVLWEERGDLQGPGWTFPSRLPHDWLITDPKQAFHAANPCSEGK